MENEVKNKIYRIIESLPEKKLIPVLDYVTAIEKATVDKSETTRIVQKILLEDTALLKKLAE